MQLIGNQ